MGMSMGMQGAMWAQMEWLARQGRAGCAGRQQASCLLRSFKEMPPSAFHVSGILFPIFIFLFISLLTVLISSSSSSSSSSGFCIWGCVFFSLFDLFSSGVPLKRLEVFVSRSGVSSVSPSF
ncbi:unnamed protein product [Citrullus colocynthis]|uniref:Uncharacterized protein n=1 Tax=Citrullus colocynthis TaxID=252529 RepID=A0ABP0XYK9_9ROSI